MSIFKWTMSIIQRMEKLQQDFLWGGMGIKKRFHLVNWSSVHRPKMAGGLGFRPLKLMNQALLGKWLWRIGDQSDSLRKDILMSKLCLSMELGRNDCNVPGPSYRFSSLWKGIMDVNDALASHIKYRVGSREDIFFWHDIWWGINRQLYNSLNYTGVP